MTEITNSQFDATAHPIAVVDFWAPWCVPCTIFLPTFKRVAQEFTNVAFFKANVDENRELTKQQEIAGIPAILIFKNGTVVKRLVGMQTETQLREAITQAIDAV